MFFRVGRSLELGLIGAAGIGGALGVVACGRGLGGNPPIVVAAVEVADGSAPVTTGAVTSQSQDGRGEAPACAFDVEVDEIAPSSPTCTIYEQITRGGQIHLPCGGADGPAHATFGEHDYRGEVRSRFLVLKHSYDFQEKDGCMWRVNGKISGNASTGKVSWSYAEEILEDDQSNCWATCTARTALKLTPVR